MASSSWASGTQGHETQEDFSTGFTQSSGPASQLSLFSPFPPAALLGIGISLPNVVNLRYVTPEVFVHEVRACGCDQRGLFHPWKEAELGEVGVTSVSLPASTNSGAFGSARPGGTPAPAKTTP